MQVSATFSSDSELQYLRNFASTCGLCQVGHVVRKPYYRRVKFITISDSDTTNADCQKTVLERNQKKFYNER